VRKIFSQRARLVVYVESESADRMTERARSEGKTLVEWMRETLLGELEDNSAVRGTTPVRMARRRTSVSGRLLAAEPVLHMADSLGDGGGVAEDVPVVRTCKHGTERGVRCWQCGGIAVIE